VEIAFEGISEGYKIPYYKTYKYYHLKGLVVPFELEVRLINYVPPNAEYDYLEAERTDNLPLLECVQRHTEDMRISFRNPQ
jgi:hypothetical protein